MVHVDSNDSANGGVVEGGYPPSEFNSEGPKIRHHRGLVFTGRVKKTSRFDHGLALIRLPRSGPDRDR